MNSKDIAIKIIDIPVEEIIRDLLPQNKIIPEPNQYSADILKTDCFLKGVSSVPELYFDKSAFFCFECGKRGNQYDFVRYFYEDQEFNSNKYEFSTEKYFLNKLSLKINSKNIHLVYKAQYESILEFARSDLYDIHKGAELVGKYLLNNGTWESLD